MHPDQNTPDSHRYRAPDSKTPRTTQENDAIDETGANVRTPEPEEKRLGEAGNEYVGRQMDDALKAHPRVDDADEVQEE